MDRPSPTPPGVSYLRSKRSVDDRALNRPVLDVVRARLPDDRRVRVLELGGGVGTMVDRLIAWSVLSDADYTLVDLDPDHLAAAREQVDRWRAAGIDVHVVSGEIERHLRDDAASYDLVIANAVLDLVELDRVLPLVFARLEADGVLWCSINFDGETIFAPAHPSDEAILAAYHASMGVDRRQGRPIGDARTGRRLFAEMRAAGGDVLAAGSSDWVVFAGPTGYPEREADFVRHILDTIELELRDHPEVGPRMGAWLEARHRQVDEGSLVYIAHQLDLAGARRR